MSSSAQPSMSGPNNKDSYAAQKKPSSFSGAIMMIALFSLTIFLSAALLFLVEPSLRLVNQGAMWSIGYVVLVVLVFASAVVLWRSSPAPSHTPPDSSSALEEAPPPPA